MPRPERADRRDDLAPLLRRSSHEPMQHPSAEIAPVQDYVDDEHKTDYGVPCRDHPKCSFLGSRSIMFLSTAENHCFVRTAADLTTLEKKKKQTEHNVQADEANQRKDCVAAAHYLAVAVARLKNAVD